MNERAFHREPEECANTAAAYVLGALTAEECEAFQRHLESCAPCRDAVAEVQPVADALTSAVPQLEAPADLRARVVSSAYDHAREQGSAEAGRVSSRRAPGRLRWRPALAMAVLAGAVGALVGVALAPGGSSRVRVIRAVVQVPRASALLRVSAGHAELEIVGMPQSAPSRVYEVWIKRGSALVPTDALFTVTGRGRATVAVPGNVRGAAAILVTSEPRGGSPAPTRQPVIVAPLS